MSKPIDQEDAIKKIISDYTHRTVIRMDHNLSNDLNLKPKQVIDILLIIDIEFGVGLGDDLNTHIKTVQDLCNGVNKLTKYKNNTLH